MAAAQNPNQRGGSADRAGDALDEALAGCQDELYGMLYFLVGDAKAADEAFRQAFSQCWRHRRSAAQAVDLRPWMFRVGLFAARRMRKRGGLHRGAASAPQSSPREATAQDPLEQLRQALRQLPPAEKEVFLLRQNGKLTFAQIGETVNRPEGTVRAQMRAALCKLQATPDENHP